MLKTRVISASSTPPRRWTRPEHGRHGQRVLEPVGDVVAQPAQVVHPAPGDVREAVHGHVRAQQLETART
jgi:hypothetical protein